MKRPFGRGPTTLLRGRKLTIVIVINHLHPLGAHPPSSGYLGPNFLLKGFNRWLDSHLPPTNSRRSGATMALAKKFSAARFWRDAWAAWGFVGLGVGVGVVSWVLVTKFFCFFSGLVRFDGVFFCCEFFLVLTLQILGLILKRYRVKMGFVWGFKGLHETIYWRW